MSIPWEVRVRVVNLSLNFKMHEKHVRLLKEEIESSQKYKSKCVGEALPYMKGNYNIIYKVNNNTNGLILFSMQI